MAAVLACGQGALLAGRAAAYLLGILKGRPPAPEVATPGKRRVKGVRTRRTAPGHATVWRGIAVSNPARTLVDLAAYLTEEDLARACHEAGVRHHTTPAQVEAVLARRPKTRGVARLRAVLHGEVHVTLSRLERHFLYLLTVELDSYRYHRSRHAWERDRRREREARARGDEFRRYTYGDVFEDPELMPAELRALYAFGSMFWLTRKMLSGSYFALICASRS